jgi:ADP-ribose pyrophosphatase YjhB (NUDIX family)
MNHDKKFTFEIRALIQNKHNDFLLVANKHNDTFHWNIPSKKIDFGENIYSALWGFINEKTGLDVDILMPFNVSGNVVSYEHIIGTTFVCKSDDSDVYLDKSYNHYEWISANKILDSDYPKEIKDEIRSYQVIKKKNF